MSSRPCSVSVTWMVGLGVIPLPGVLVPGFPLFALPVLGLPPYESLFPELSGPGPAGAGTIKVVSAVFAGLLLPAVFVNQTASVHVPGPGTVTLTGPSAGPVTGVSQAWGSFAGRIW